MKKESWNIGNSLQTHPNSPKQDHFRGNPQDSPKRVHFSEVGLFLVKLTQASNNSLRQDVT